jgi:hypothetical protein
LVEPAGGAIELAAVVPGAVLIAGSDRFWAVVRIERVDDDRQVHLAAVPPDDPARSASAARPDPPETMYQRCTRPSVNSGEV